MFSLYLLIRFISFKTRTFFSPAAEIEEKFVFLVLYKYQLRTKFLLFSHGSTSIGGRFFFFTLVYWRERSYTINFINVAKIKTTKKAQFTEEEKRDSQKVSPFSLFFFIR